MSGAIGRDGVRGGWNTIVLIIQIMIMNSMRSGPHMILDCNITMMAGLCTHHHRSSSSPCHHHHHRGWSRPSQAVTSLGLWKGGLKGLVESCTAVVTSGKEKAGSKAGLHFDVTTTLVTSIVFIVIFPWMIVSLRTVDLIMTYPPLSPSRCYRHLTPD